MPQRPATLYAAHPGDDRPHPGLAIVHAPGRRHPAAGPPVEASAPLPRDHAASARHFLAAIAALVLGVGSLTLARRAHRHAAAVAHGAGRARARRGPGRAHPLDTRGPTEVRQAADGLQPDAARAVARARSRSAPASWPPISHDLQTPITRLRLRAELIDDEGLRDAHAGRPRRPCRAWSKEGLAYAASTVAPQEVAIQTELDALAASVVADYADAGQPVTLVGASGRTVLVRPKTLARLLGNLIDNALKFGGSAELVLEVAEGRPVILVRDRGPGIPEAELDKVFEPFYRLESSRNRETGGTGLGLAIARQLAAALGAELSLRNLAQGGLEARVLLATDRPGSPTGAAG
jgi:signal transduction histidine kinase